MGAQHVSAFFSLGVYPLGLLYPPTEILWLWNPPASEYMYTTPSTPALEPAPKSKTALTPGGSPVVTPGFGRQTECELKGN
jgi:hypothetical protein